MLLRQWLENLYTHTGNDAKQDLLIIDAETGLLSQPSTLECVSSNSGILFPKESTLTAWISWRRASLSCSIVRGVFLYTLPFNRPQRKKSTGVRSVSPCLLLFNQFLDVTLRWCMSFTKFRSKCRLACFKWTGLPVFTNEKPALFDCIHRQ